MKLLPLLLLVTLATFTKCTLGTEVQGNLIDCIFDEDAGTCATKRISRELDDIELEISGKTETPVSKVIEETGKFVAEVFSGAEEEEGEEITEQEEIRGLEEARKKKFGKKKKKHLQKLFALAMLLKSKLGLLLQLISTHFQVKFFVIAVISLIINAGRFWLDLKKSHHPSKVIYYEHAQHQHHYDHDEDHGYWARSLEVEDTSSHPQELAYSAYAPTR